MRAETRTILTMHKDVVTQSSRFRVSNEGSKMWRLHIREVKVSDQGCYMCQINTNSMRKQIGCIDVHGKLQIWWRQFLKSISGSNICSCMHLFVSYPSTQPKTIET